MRLWSWLRVTGGGRVLLLDILVGRAGSTQPAEAHSSERSAAGTALRTATLLC